MDSPIKRMKFIGCEVLHREACHLAAVCPTPVDVEFLRKGLHDLETVDMLDKIQQTVDAADATGLYSEILLGYARCNDGLVGLTARTVPLVMPKAHDCITLFFGSRDAYRRYFDQHPGTYYMTTGWFERNLETSGQWQEPAYGKAGVMAKLGLADSYDDMVAKYGKDNADYIIQTMGDWRDHYTHCLYLTMGVCDESAFIDSARQRALDNGWQFLQQDGDLSLLERLFTRQWNDDEFLIVHPGQRIVSRNDQDVLAVEPAE